jgi:D-alanyl-D-alanine carboxypeptidase (penicillin-binding protein 5/6)
MKSTVWALSLLAATGMHAAVAAQPASSAAVAPPASAAAPVPKAPSVDARAYLLIDEASGQTLAESNADQRMEPASITKLMSAYLVFQALKDGRLSLNDPVTISEHAWRAEGSRTFVQVGTQVPVDVLVHGMIVQSGNDATIALAEKVGGTEPAFVEMMNTTAQRLGMTSTHFEDSSGLPSPTHYSTARDIATLSRALIRDFPDRYPLYSIKEFTWNKITQGNRNGLLTRDPSVDGIKTGHTDSAGYCLVTSAKRQGTRLISVVLGTKSEKAREDASAALINYGFTFYETIDVKKAHDTVLQPRVYKGAEASVAVGPASDLRLTVPRGQSALITTAATLREPLIAPLATNVSIGELQVTLNGKVISRTPLYPIKAVAEAGWWGRTVDSVSLWFK